jgi:hypothetical protein
VVTIDGAWAVAIATPIGTQRVTLTFATTDGGLAGTATQGADVVPLIEPRLAGDRLTWTQHVTRPLRLTLRFEVVVAGDTMTGTAKAGLLPASRLTGQRVP